MVDLIGRHEAAQILGVAPDSVRSTLRRYGITEQRGYDRGQVEQLRRVGQGGRTDLAAAEGDGDAALRDEKQPARRGRTGAP